MKTTVAFIFLSLWTAADEADVVYIQPPEEMGVSIRALDQKSFREKAEQYARAAAIKADVSGDFEIRIWRMDAMTGDGVGYLLRDGQARVFNVMRRGNRYTARPVSTRQNAVSEALADAASDVSLLTGNEYSCGIMDGESVLIETSIGRSRYELWAGNPDSCKDKYSKRIAHLLRLVDAAARRSEP